MQIQKVLSRKYNKKEYYKYLIVIPEIEMTKSEFVEGEILEVETKKGEIKIRKKK